MYHLLIIFLLSASCAMAKYPLSDHYDGETFSNLTPTDHKSIFTVLKWKLTTDAKAWPEKIENKDYELSELGPNDPFIITWVNHASFLIRFHGLTILTDPIYAERASPLSFAGPKRVREPGIVWEKMPKVDVVLISHNHYDHLDLETIKRLNEKFSPVFVVPLGDKDLLESIGVKNIEEKDWWEEIRFEDKKITFLPSQHWSARGLFDKSKSLWGSYMIDNGQQRIYFAGDTGYGKHFKLIKEKYGSPDIALLPIGAYEPRWFMKDHHMNPEDAVLAHRDLGAKKSVGMHFGTFQLTDEWIDAPVKDLELARQKYELKPNDFVVLDVGESLWP
ncbi:MAG: MBL fold metallo-hydrolase [Bacteriovoracaceae bacterium]